MTRSKGFTLIELLIVVAIIAILAAIAVPNFLEAQVRSKVSRAKADMRSLATAIEAYTIDYNRAPLLAAPGSTLRGGSGPNVGLLNGPSVFNPGVAGGGVSSRFIALTTPVSFISSVFRDPFIAPNAGLALSCGNPSQTASGYDTYDYVDSYTISPNGPFPSTFAPTGSGQRCAGISSGAYWHLVSAGPDFENCFGGGHIGQTGFHDGGVDYDPTNGTVSRGDVVRVASAPGEICNFGTYAPKYDRILNKTN